MATTPQTLRTSRGSLPRWRALCALLAAVPLCAPAHAGGTPQGASTRSLADLSIEELLNVEVVTANRKPQRLSDTAAAVTVISHDDIHRSGATNVPELLRAVPGVNVAWIGGDAYSVTIRGFAGRFDKQLLVLRDGRSLYTQLFSGVFWERELPLLEDIERIEVIRGPGAAVWGANAVNGVVNIITRPAGETHGTLVGVGVGSEGRRSAFARHGVALPQGDSLRLYGRGEQAQPGATPPEPGSDGIMRNGAAGLRYDRERGEARLSLQAEAHDARNGQPVEGPVPAPPYLQAVASELRLTGGFLLARYERPLGDGQSLSMQANVSHERLDMPGLVAQRRDVVTLEAQEHFRPLAGHEAMLGLSLVSDEDDIVGSHFLVFDPTSERRNTYRLLAQDEIALLEGRAHVTLGAILEHDTQAGTHAMPDLRLAIATSPASTLWFSLSRALRSPSRVERSVSFLLGPTLPAQPPQQPLAIIPSAVGTRSFGPESELGWQAGFRSQLAHDLSLDVAAFYSRYDDLRTTHPDFAGLRMDQYQGTPYLQLPLPITNGEGANARGGELSLEWRAREWWRLSASSSWVSVRSNDPANSDGIECDTPHFSATLRSMMDLGSAHVDVSSRYVGGVKSLAIVPVVVPGYVAVDARVGWSVRRNLELGLVGRNLFQGRHVEFASDYISSPIVPASRSLLATFEYSF